MPFLIYEAKTQIASCMFSTRVTDTISNNNDRYTKRVWVYIRSSIDTIYAYVCGCVCICKVFISIDIVYIYIYVSMYAYVFMYM